MYSYGPTYRVMTYTTCFVQNLRILLTNGQQIDLSTLRKMLWLYTRKAKLRLIALITPRNARDVVSIAILHEFRTQ